MRRRFLLTLVLATTASTAFADLVVLPVGNTSANGNTVTTIPLGEEKTWEFQWQLNGSSLTSEVGQDITAIGFRVVPGDASIPAGQTVSTFDLQLSSAPNTLSSLSSTFSANQGSDATTVYNSSLTLPALIGGAGPNPFFLITFTTPYLYNGGDVVFTLTTGGASTQGLVALDANLIDANGNTVGFPTGAKRSATGYYSYPITELQFNGATATPEPASLVLVGSAMLGLAALRRRRNAR